ncbi:DNA-binding protein [Phenylobacterium sp.]|uniref:DNA-binding protein n=1 Tax=Phenylobacterium sp. TaxID=1871053 RepID=UPI0039C9DAA9
MSAFSDAQVFVERAGRAADMGELTGLLSEVTRELGFDHGTGPTYRKIGGRVVYTLADLEDWAQRGTRASTSDEGRGVVLPAKRHAAVAPAYRKL